MRIAYITAGAAGMFCGSCMKDNTLVAALQRRGHDALLLPTYTPILTDEVDVSTPRIFLGGINVYLQQISSLFRHMPRFVDRLLDNKALLRWVSQKAVKTDAADLGDLTLSILDGTHGKQKKETERLVRFLANELKPDVVNLTNALLAGMAPDLKARLKAPILCTLQGDDIFLEMLPAAVKKKALEHIRALCRSIDGFIATSVYYADFMAGYFAIPRDKIHVVYPGLNLKGHGAPRSPRGDRPFTIGYFARVCPEKGLHVLVEAFRQLKGLPGAEKARLRVGGWLGGNNVEYFKKLSKQIAGWGMQNDFERVQCPDHDSKVQFFHEIDVLSVPTTYREPKGIYVLEALANGVPVVQPRHGSFPELIEATGGGLLVHPDDPADLARGLKELHDAPHRLEEFGKKGKEVVHRRFHSDRMAEETTAIYERYLGNGER